VFVAAATFGTGADVADAGQGVFAISAILPLNEEELIGAVDGNVARQRVCFVGGMMMVVAHKVSTFQVGCMTKMTVMNLVYAKPEAAGKVAFYLEGMR
jgi:hypothetical protein